MEEHGDTHGLFLTLPVRGRVVFDLAVVPVRWFVRMFIHSSFCPFIFHRPVCLLVCLFLCFVVLCSVGVCGETARQRCGRALLCLFACLFVFHRIVRLLFFFCVSRFCFCFFVVFCSGGMWRNRETTCGRARSFFRSFSAPFFRWCGECLQGREGLLSVGQDQLPR